MVLKVEWCIFMLIVLFDVWLCDVHVVWNIICFGNMYLLCQVSLNSQLIQWGGSGLILNNKNSMARECYRHMALKWYGNYVGWLPKLLRHFYIYLEYRN